MPKLGCQLPLFLTTPLCFTESFGVFAASVSVVWFFVAFGLFSALVFGAVRSLWPWACLRRRFRSFWCLGRARRRFRAFWLLSCLRRRARICGEKRCHPCSTVQGRHTWVIVFFMSTVCVWSTGFLGSTVFLLDGFVHSTFFCSWLTNLAAVLLLTGFGWTFFIGRHLCLIDSFFCDTSNWI